jgi:hypothetical protein
MRSCEILAEKKSHALSWKGEKETRSQFSVDISYYLLPWGRDGFLGGIDILSLSIDPVYSPVDIEYE